MPEHEELVLAVAPCLLGALNAETARKPLEGARGYEAGAYVGSFAGLGPIDDPRLVVAVMIDEPRAGGYYGGQVAAPVFSEIMGFALGHQRVPPSGDPEVPAPVPTPTATPTAVTTVPTRTTAG